VPKSRRQINPPKVIPLFDTIEAMVNAPRNLRFEWSFPDTVMPTAPIIREMMIGAKEIRKFPRNILRSIPQ